MNLKLWGAGTARTLRPIWMAEELGLQVTLSKGVLLFCEYNAFNTSIFEIFASSWRNQESRHGSHYVFPREYICFLLCVEEGLNTFDVLVRRKKTRRSVLWTTTERKGPQRFAAPLRTLLFFVRVLYVFAFPH